MGGRLASQAEWHASKSLCGRSTCHIKCPILQLTGRKHWTRIPEKETYIHTLTYVVFPLVFLGKIFFANVGSKPQLCGSFPFAWLPGCLPVRLHVARSMRNSTDAGSCIKYRQQRQGQQFVFCGNSNGNISSIISSSSSNGCKSMAWPGFNRCISW